MHRLLIPLIFFVLPTVLYGCEKENVVVQDLPQGRLLFDRSQMLFEVGDKQSLTLLNFGEGEVLIESVDIEDDSFDFQSPQEFPHPLKSQSSLVLSVECLDKGTATLVVSFTQNKLEKKQIVRLSTLREKEKCESDNSCIRAYVEDGRCIKENLTGRSCNDGRINTNDDRCANGHCVGEDKDFNPGFDTADNARGATWKYLANEQ